MNAALPKFLKSAYRKEPLPSILVTAGAVDAVIGGLGDRWSLFAFGLATIGGAIALRWWLQQQNTSSHPPESRTPRYLPPSNPAPMPMLTVSKRSRRR